MTMWAMTTLACLGACLCMPLTQAAGRYAFLRPLAEEPCTLAIEDEVIELDFSSVNDKEFYLNRRTLGRPIFQHFQSCDLSLGKRLLNITFRGPESTTSPDLLVLQDTSQGVVIGLETQEGRALPLNQTQPMGELIGGENLITFIAYLQGEPDAIANRTLAWVHLKQRSHLHSATTDCHSFYNLLSISEVLCVQPAQTSTLHFVALGRHDQCSGLDHYTHTNAL